VIKVYKIFIVSSVDIFAQKKEKQESAFSAKKKKIYIKKKKENQIDIL
jgi:hypothetical protein